MRIIKLFTAQDKMKDNNDEVKEYGKQTYPCTKGLLSNPLSEFFSITTVAVILLIGGGWS